VVGRFSLEYFISFNAAPDCDADQDADCDADPNADTHRRAV
jgi:hypothetical protein